MCGKMKYGKGDGRKRRGQWIFVLYMIQVNILPIFKWNLIFSPKKIQILRTPPSIGELYAQAIYSL